VFGSAIHQIVFNRNLDVKVMYVWILEIKTAFQQKRDPVHLRPLSRIDCFLRESPVTTCSWKKWLFVWFVSLTLSVSFQDCFNWSDHKVNRPDIYCQTLSWLRGRGRLRDKSWRKSFAINLYLVLFFSRIKTRTTWSAYKALELTQNSNKSLEFSLRQCFRWEMLGNCSCSYISRYKMCGSLSAVSLMTSCWADSFWNKKFCSTKFSSKLTRKDGFKVCFPSSLVCHSRRNDAVPSSEITRHNHFIIPYILPRRWCSWCQQENLRIWSSWHSAWCRRGCSCGFACLDRKESCNHRPGLRGLDFLT